MNHEPPFTATANIASSPIARGPLVSTETSSTIQQATTTITYISHHNLTVGPPPITTLNTVISTTAVTVASTAASPDTSAQKRTHTGAIVGGVVGGIIGFALLGSLFWYLARRRRNFDLDKHLDSKCDPDPIPASNVGEYASSGGGHYTGRPIASPSTSHTTLQHPRTTCSFHENGARQRVDLGDVQQANMSMISASGATTSAHQAPGASPALPSAQHHHQNLGYVPGIPMSSHGGQGVGYGQRQYSVGGSGAGCQGCEDAGYARAGGYNGPYDQGARRGRTMSSASWDAAAYYGRNEKHVLSPLGQEPQGPLTHPEQQQYYGGPQGQGNRSSGYYEGGPMAGPPTHTTSASSSEHGYNTGYMPRAMSAEGTPGVLTNGPFAYGQSHTGSGSQTGSGMGSGLSAKEKKARAHVSNPGVEGGGNVVNGMNTGSGGEKQLVQHLDGGRVIEEEERRSQTDIPPAYDSIVR